MLDVAIVGATPSEITLPWIEESEYHPNEKQGRE